LEYSWSGGVWLKTNEVRYVYDGLLATQERDGSNNTPIVTYTRGNDVGGGLAGYGGIGGLLGRSDSGLLTLGGASGHAYYAADGKGNVTCLFNASNALVARYTYDAFGNILSKSGSLAEVNG